jgi:hypothetical protein
MPREDGHPVRRGLCLLDYPHARITGQFETVSEAASLSSDDARRLTIAIATVEKLRAQSSQSTVSLALLLVTVRDTRGLEFPTAGGAIEHCKELGRRLRGAPRLGNDPTLSISVIDESGAEIHRERCIGVSRSPFFRHVDAARGAIASSAKAVPPRPREACWCGGDVETSHDEACLDDAPPAAPRADEPGGFRRFEMIQRCSRRFFRLGRCRTTITLPRHLHSLITRHRVSPIHRARSRLDRRHAAVAPNANATTAWPAS